MLTFDGPNKGSLAICRGAQAQVGLADPSASGRCPPAGRRAATVRPRRPVWAAGVAAAGYYGATAPYYGSGGPYAYYGGQDYATRNGFVCQPGTMVRLEDGRMHPCQ